MSNSTLGFVALGLLGLFVAGVAHIAANWRHWRADDERRARERAEDAAVAARLAEAQRVRTVLEERQAEVIARQVATVTPRARVLTPAQRSIDHDARLLAELDTLVYDPSVWEQ